MIAARKMRMLITKMLHPQVGTQAVGQTAAQTVGQTVGQTAGQTVGQQLVQRLLQKVRGGQPSQVRGGSAGLAALPGNLLCGELTAIITALREAIYKASCTTLTNTCT